MVPGDSNRKKKVEAVSVSISLSLFIIVFLGFCIWMRMIKNNAKIIANRKLYGNSVYKQLATN